MAFDSATRGKLQRLVTACRNLLTEEFDDQLQSIYGIYAEEGRVLELDKLTNLDDEQRSTGSLLRERIAHLQSGLTGSKTALRDAVQRVLREQAFTVLNRFAALRLAEERELVIECVGQGMRSKGLQVFEGVASSELGSQYERYCLFLNCLFDELSVDLGVLFDRFSPFGLLFPREPALLQFFDLLNDPELKSLWCEDETIGWIYQYFNDEAERKKMREESAAPRNSRELAVRNQFFTPRYVVEFLTDNTLGRIWYEMTRGATKLKQQCQYLVRRPHEIFSKPGETAPEQPKQGDLSQEELLKQPVFIPDRPLKDPRTILMLDPACGSMHFGLYAFDLFEIIYEEWWDNFATGEQKAQLVADFQARDGFPQQPITDNQQQRALFARHVPRLIIEHNIHGIDIDPRCAQIAGLSLWLRAQKAWQRLGLKPAERPTIKRSNIVCAEPMPGEKELLREFVEKQFPAAEQPIFAHLLGVVFDKMKLAGEAGSLLKIEEEIRSAIADAKNLWKEGPKLEQTRLFHDLEAAKQKELKIDTSGITDEQFWEQAEQRIYDALEAYAEQAENGGGFQRRLFADDAAQGFAFIDLCRKRYDVIAKNPPFGDPSKAANLYLQKIYVAPKHDIASAFVERAIELLARDGRVGCITTRTIFFLSYLAEWRKEVVLNGSKLLLFCDCGYGVLDAIIECALSVLTPKGTKEQRSCFFRTIKQDTREQDLLLARNSIESGVLGAGCFVCDTATFEAIPKAPFAYWVSDKIRLLFSSLPCFESEGRIGVIGALCQDDFRFVRAFWEFDPVLTARSWTAGGPKKSVTYSNGGSHTPVFADPPLCVNWGNDGSELKAFLSSYRRSKGFSDQWTSQLNAYDRYFRPALTWSSRPSSQGSFWILSAGGIFGNSGPAVFCSSRASFLWTLAVMNSQVFRALLGLLMPRGTTGEQTLKYELGYVRAVPMPLPEKSDESDVGALMLTSCNALQRVSTFDETAHLFCRAGSIRSKRSNDTEDELILAVNQASDGLSESFDCIDIIAERLFRLTNSDRENLLRHSNVEPVSRNVNLNAVLQLSEDAPWPKRLISYAFGSVFGRWDIRYATGERPAPELPDPFAPLPVCPPGMLQGDDGLPLSPKAGRRLRDEGRYPLDAAWDGILVDDPEHPLNLERRVHAALALLGTDRADALEHEACALLGVPTLRDWFRRPAGFFADHLKRYSKSRRQAPIYWPLSTASGSYTLWIYYHRLNDQTLYTCVTDFVKPKLDAVTADADRLQAKTQTGGTAKERAELQEVRDFQAELHELHDELLRVAQLPWKPNLNDGVLITASPLWKLFRLPKWQKDLKACWEKLAAGHYDWAHLALIIWPDRVRENCKTDRSLAIAHGLEHLCEVEAPKPKGKRKKKEEITLV